jgi:hypothetical protein
MLLLELVSHEHFGGINAPVLGDQMVVLRDARDPGSSGGKLVIEDQIVRREAQGLSTAECQHYSDELPVDDRSVYGLWRGSVRK